MDVRALERQDYLRDQLFSRNSVDVIKYLLHHAYFSTRLCRANILLYTGNKDTTATSRKVAYISFFIV